MATDDRVIIKGVRDGLLILLDDSASWGMLLADLESRLAARRAFFSGATVTANLGARILDEPEFGALRSVLDRFDMTLDVVVARSTQTRAVAGVNGVRNRAPSFVSRRPESDLTTDPAEFPPRARRVEPRPAPPAPAHTSASALPEGVPSPPADSEPDFGALAGEDTAAEAEATWAGGSPAALFVHRTLRSGMSIQHDGDVCILGDVNAGAEVVAGGDVVVWGILRGMVHAGAGGDQAAAVCALLLAPTQLRIADVVSRGSAPDGPGAPETARIVDGRIRVEAWSGRRRA